MPSVLLYTNTVAPYRLPLFERLSQTVNLKVLFAQGRTADRRWDTALDAYTFRYAILSHRALRLGNATQILNPGLLSQFWRGNPEVAILGDNRQAAMNGLGISLAAWIRRSPIIVWTGITPGEINVARSVHVLQRLFAVLRRFLFRRASAIVAYGTASRRHLVELGVPEEKIFSGTQVVPPTELPPPGTDRASLGLADKKVVLSVNYLVPRKGLDLLIRAFRKVRNSNAVLVLVGSGPEEDRLRRLAAGDRRILFPGYQAGASKTAWYAAADVFVFPTLHDPWGLVVNEAMTFGLPIIATDAAGCAPDLVQDNGLVIPAGDIGALEDALARLLGDEAQRSMMGQRSREVIRKYTVEYACNAFLQAIDCALSKPCQSS